MFLSIHLMDDDDNFILINMYTLLDLENKILNVEYTL